MRRRSSREVLGALSSCLKRRCIVFCYQAFSSSSSLNSSRDGNSLKKEMVLREEAAARAEAYRQLENLDFKSAANILFTTPPKRKKFGLDFHLVQLFFACLPSLAVYLVAQYARSEIRRMEAEVEQKKKKEAEEEDRLKEAELSSTKEESNNEISEVKTRLDALEETVKEIVDEKRRSFHGDSGNNQKAINQNLESADKKPENQNKIKGFGGEMQRKDANIPAISSKE